MLEVSSDFESLPNFAATLSAAADGRASLAMSNVMGSMAVNLGFPGILPLYASALALVFA